MECTWRVRATLVLTALSVLIAPASAGVTEEEALRVFLEQSPQARRPPVIERAVDAALRAETRIANPELSYQVEDAAGVRDEFLTFQQELPITGRQGLLNERARVAATVAAMDGQQALLGDVYGLKQAFYEVLYRQHVLEQLRESGELLDRTVEILDKREREGEGSGYDVLRAEQELAQLRMDVSEANAALAAARALFGSFFDSGSSIATSTLEGDLQPTGTVPDVGNATRAALEQRLDLRSLSAQEKRLDLERRAANRRRIPEPVLTAGWKQTETLGLSDSGYVAAVTVPLPVFNRGRLSSARAAAEGERVELDREILTRRIRAEVETAIARERALREAAEQYGADVERRARDLNRIAQLKYDAGEGGILDLLDAHRTSLTSQLRALATRHAAKVAEIERNRVIGNEVTP
ncbi:MAG: TolC family protein [Acidobacteria bacterium]|nr:TolC family protein [Acidobacteriota bacterium]NIM62642.1 TolC family protein [Acidobacteriota bacterium]NIO60760.1 TolC family protein [Acidobacteriota bacterium]NIQ31831.1 TolC family protein [Acidobacteriota bacterium]NIQ87158.1 TolC family protein [Acidobacteriota bacterium]